MNKRFQFAGVCFISFLLAVIFTMWNGPLSGAQEKKSLLADRHQAKGTDCAGCHKESPPKASVPMAACLKCHGSYAQVAKKTDNKSPNPHASHMGEVACENCHRGHKPPVDRCAECHEFGYKVP